MLTDMLWYKNKERQKERKQEGKEGEEIRDPTS